ncbi:MAG: ankyrin repeat domain-containing protein [Gammaproteobacteria bacterium]
MPEEIDHEKYRMSVKKQSFFLSLRGAINSLLTAVNKKLIIDPWKMILRSYYQIRYIDIHNASKCGIVTAVRGFISAGVNINIRDHLDLTPLHHAASQGKVAVLKILIEGGSDLEARAHGKTPLHLAAASGRSRAVRALIRSGANLEARDDENMTPLHLAALWGHKAVVRSLVEGGANINATFTENAHDIPIVLAFENDQDDIVQYFLGLGVYLPEQPLVRLENVNNHQSVHTVSVHIGVSKAAQALKEKYVPRGQREALHRLELAISDLKQFIKELPYNPESDPITNKNGAAQRCLTWLLTVDFTDLRSNVRLNEAIALVWLALTDPEQLARIRRERGSSDSEKEMIASELEAKLKMEENTALKEVIVQWLYEIVRGYNLSKKGFDDGKPDNHTCPSGSFNKTIYTLNGRHSAVNIAYVTKETIIQKAMKSVEDNFNELDDIDKFKFAKEFDGGVISGELLQVMQKTLTLKLHKEFDDFHSEGLDVDKIISDILVNMEYMPPKGLIQLSEECKRSPQAISEQAACQASPSLRI